jgi:hypothetical protein
MKRTKIGRSIAILAAVVIGTGLGAVGVSAFAANSNRQAPQANDGHAKPNFPLNAAGNRYGSLKDAPTPEDSPDLIAAIGTKGVEGFVKRDDFFEPLPSSVAEALSRNRRPSHTVPLYSVDGKTIVDQFLIGGNDTALRSLPK